MRFHANVLPRLPPPSPPSLASWMTRMFAPFSTRSYVENITGFSRTGGRGSTSSRVIKRLTTNIRRHGHLGLLLSDTIYGSLTNNVIFVIAVNPGPFVPLQEPWVHKLTPQKTFGRNSVPPSKSVMRLSKFLSLRSLRSLILPTSEQCSTRPLATMQPTSVRCYSISSPPMVK